MEAAATTATAAQPETQPASQPATQPATQAGAAPTPLITQGTQDVQMGGAANDKRPRDNDDNGDKERMNRDPVPTEPA
eukprot:2007048-Prorocentrum_lima.AAC.1